MNEQPSGAARVVGSTRSLCGRCGGGCAVSGGRADRTDNNRSCRRAASPDAGGAAVTSHGGMRAWKWQSSAWRSRSQPPTAASRATDSDRRHNARLSLITRARCSHASSPSSGLSHGLQRRFSRQLLRRLPVAAVVALRRRLLFGVGCRVRLAGLLVFGEEREVHHCAVVDQPRA